MRFIHGRLNIENRAVDSDRGKVIREVPLSYAQERLWVLDRLVPRNTAYHIPRAYRMNGDVDEEALVESVKTIVRRHASLRTTFAIVDKLPRQRIYSTIAPDVKIVDLQDVPGKELEKVLEVRMDQVIRDPFDLAKGPLVRFRLFRIAPRESVMLFVIHHIVSDGWSTSIFLNELCAGYSAFVEGEERTCPSLPISYDEFAVMQREQLSGAKLDALVEYWQVQLHNAPDVLRLPFDHLRPDKQAYAGVRYEVSWPIGLSRSVKDLSRRERVTPYMTVLAGLAVLLGRYADQDDLVIGSPIANRTLAGVEKLIGFFVNTLVMRVDLTGDPTFRELLARVRRVALDAYDHQELPFAKLVASVQPTRRLNRSPLFQVFYGLQNMPAADEQMPGISLVRIDLPNAGAKFDLTIMLRETKDTYVGYWEYDRDLFDEGTIRRMARHLDTILEKVVSDPNIRVSRVPIMEANERSRLLQLWNNTQRSYPSRCIHALFEEQVAKSPANIALHDGEEMYTFDELNSFANRLAYRLNDCGVGPGSFVGIHMRRSALFIAAALGIMKVGAAYCPMDPRMPSPYLERMVVAASLAVVVVDKQTDSFSLFRATAVKAHEMCGGIRAENPPARGMPDDPAWVLFTSGSTGQPKAVIGTHRGAVNRFNWMWETYPFEEGAVCCQRTPVGFVDAVWECFGPLLCGVPVVVLPDDVIKDPLALINALETHRITRLCTVPALLRLLLDRTESPEPRLSDLRICVSSGEALPPNLVVRFYRCLPQARLLNLYGSTEVSADALYFETSSSCGELEIPIGKPIYNMRAYVLDKHLQPVPIGAPGILYLAGDGLARGYLSNLEETDSRFLPDPFSATFGARRFCTGDQVRRRSDGSLMFLGRVDRQVKIRGHRLEPGEIESMLESHASVSEAFVVVRGKGDSVRRLAAFVAGNSLKVEDLRAFLTSRLPIVMVPAEITVLPALPRMTNGKLDRQALIDMEYTSTSTAIGPRNKSERMVANEWEMLLGRQATNIFDDFFAVGGNSLLAVSLFERLSAWHKAHIPVSMIFEVPTIAAQARWLRLSSSDHHWHYLVPMQEGAQKPALFCIHNLSGNVLHYGALARRLGSDIPVYGLQGQGQDGRGIRFDSVENMAVAYLEEVREIQPKGPYHLLSFCLGSRIAFEMARQLDACGAEVGVLAFVDGIGPGLRRPRRRMNLIDTYGAYLVGKGMEKGDLRSRFRLGMSIRRLRYRRHMQHVMGQLMLRAGRRVPRTLVAGYLLEANRAILRRYKAQPFNGSIVIFRSSRLASFIPDLGWEPFAAGGVETHDVEGPHRLLIEPYVGEVSRMLKDYLTKRSG